MSYLFGSYFVAFFGICIRAFGALGVPGIAIDASKGFLWFDIVLLITDCVCLVWIMDFMRRYANGENYSKILLYTETTVERVLFVPV